MPDFVSQTTCLGRPDTNNLSSPARQLTMLGQKLTPWNLEVAMNGYEIRILDTHGSAAITSAATYYNDDAAIRSAKKLAKNRQFEVWRGLNRIFPSRTGTPSPSRPSHNLDK